MILPWILFLGWSFIWAGCTLCLFWKFFSETPSNTSVSWFEYVFLQQHHWATCSADLFLWTNMLRRTRFWSAGFSEFTQFVNPWEAQWCRALIFIVYTERRFVELQIQPLSNNLRSQIHLFQHWQESRYIFLPRMASRYLGNRAFLYPAQKIKELLSKFNNFFKHSSFPSIRRYCFFSVDCELLPLCAVSSDIFCNNSCWRWMLLHLWKHICITLQNQMYLLFWEMKG